LKLYTGFGDKGFTSLFGGEVVRKNHLRVECYGTIDELNSMLGVLRTKIRTEEVDTILLRLQNQLFYISSEIAASGEESAAKLNRLINEADIRQLETEIDEFTKRTDPLKNFILPGGSEDSAYCHLARTICRRAERILTSLDDVQKVRGDIIKFMNRLSDLLFILARYLNHEAGIADVIWKGSE